MENSNHKKRKKKTLNALMKYMRDEKGIEVNGSTQKKQLLNIGYYHGYKGYKYIGTPANQIPYSDFNEILAIYNFDMSIKSLIYSYLMQIETAFKSHALETCLKLCSENFVEVYEILLDDYKKLPPSDVDYKKTLKLRLDLRNSIYSAISERYQSNLRMIQHYHHKDRPVPLWAIFEIITLGQFGLFLKTMNKNARITYSMDIDLYYKAVDQGGRLPEDIIFLLKDLRNAVAHNSAIFDCRFMTNKPSKRVKYFMEKETGIEYKDFTTIDDYLILILTLMKKLRFPKSECIRLNKSYQHEVEKLRKGIPINIYNSILGTETKPKLSKVLNS